MFMVASLPDNEGIKTQGCYGSRGRRRKRWSRKERRWGEDIRNSKLEMKSDIIFHKININIMTKLITK